MLDAPLATAILERLSEGVIAMDSRGKVLYVNPSLREMFDAPEGDVAGRSILEVVRSQELESLLRESLETGRSKSVRITLYSPVHRTIDVEALPLSDKDVVVAALHDVSQFQKLDDMRREFVANASHELRSPLTPILGFTENLKAGAAEDPVLRAEFIDLIHTNAERLQGLIEDLLNLTALESEGIGMKKEPVDWGEIIADATTIYSKQASIKGLALIAVPPATPMRVWGDRDRLKQVLANLLDNAMKYTERGEVRIETEKQNDAVTLRVSDTGIGIPATEQHRVFERFYRVDKNRSREMGGTGLGLAIVKHIIENQGGQVAVESEEGRGSTFSVTLPAAP